MRVVVTTIQPFDSHRFEARLVAGSTEVVSEIVATEGFNMIRGLNVGDELFHDVLDRCDQWRKFSEDFWSYIDHKARPLPWEYGDYDDQMVTAVLQDRPPSRDKQSQ